MGELAQYASILGPRAEKVQETCDWTVKFDEEVATTPAATELELETRRDLQARTKAAHVGNDKRAA
jgi:glutaconate CoA-transferase subunit B